MYIWYMYYIYIYIIYIPGIYILYIYRSEFAFCNPLPCNKNCDLVYCFMNIFVNFFYKSKLVL